MAANQEQWQHLPWQELEYGNRKHSAHIHRWIGSPVEAVTHPSRKLNKKYSAHPFIWGCIAQLRARHKRETVPQQKLNAYFLPYETIDRLRKCGSVKNCTLLVDPGGIPTAQPQSAPYIGSPNTWEIHYVDCFFGRWLWRKAARYPWFQRDRTISQEYVSYNPQGSQKCNYGSAPVLSTGPLSYLIALAISVHVL